jgi:ribosomal protein L9
VETLERLLPPTLEFYRAPNIPAPVRRLSPSLAATSSISAAAEAAAIENAKKNPGKPTKTPIFGSVSTTDIAANLKAILWEDKDGARVVLSPEDISFVEELEDKDRVKHLGTYDIVITLGPSESVRTKIDIRAQNS